MNYCSNCGSDKIISKIPEGDHFPRMTCESCDSIFYSNPKIVVGCIPVFEGKILLAKRGINPQKGKWNLPAGFLELNENLEDGARRECIEETDAKIKSMEISCIFHSPSNHLYIFYLTELSSSYFKINDESPEIAFFSPENIPWDDLAFDSNQYAIESFINGAKNKKNIDLNSSF
jgi:ADP-ribose pyrophosphatase YjhB (NUDIX family)